MYDACRSPACSASGLMLSDRPVCCGCAGFALPTSSFVEAPKFKCIAVSRTVPTFSTDLASFGCKCLVKHTTSSNLVPHGHNCDG